MIFIKIFIVINFNYLFELHVMNWWQLTSKIILIIILPQHFDIYIEIQIFHFIYFIKIITSRQLFPKDIFNLLKYNPLIKICNISIWYLYIYFTNLIEYKMVNRWQHFFKIFLSTCNFYFNTHIDVFFCSTTFFQRVTTFFFTYFGNQLKNARL